MREGATRLSQLPSVLNRLRSIIDLSVLLNESLCSGNRANLINSLATANVLRCSGGRDASWDLGWVSWEGYWGEYSIDFPGSLRTNEVPDILRQYRLLGFFCRLKNVSPNRDNGTFNRSNSNTDVVEKVNSLVAASQNRRTSVVE